jgi:hypothetical protein
VAFATAAGWVARLADAHTAGRLQASWPGWAATHCWSSTRWATSPSSRSRQPVLPAGLGPLRTRVADRHLQHAVRPLGEVFGDDVVAAAMIDRLVHHADVVARKGDSYRLKNRDLGRVPAAATNES